ncbi:MAG: hypothetical protein ACC650_09695 [Gammaproteobacteria bacterium]
MKVKIILLGFFSLVIMQITGCVTPSPGTQIILLGESSASGSDAVMEANNKVTNAAGSGCKAISVGGYATGGEGLIIGVPVLLDCPLNTQLLPDGTAVP